MIEIITAVFLSIAFLDLRILRSRRADVFARVFTVSGIFWKSCAAVVLAVIMFAPNTGSSLAVLSMAICFPLYFERRMWFLRREKEDSPENTDPQTAEEAGFLARPSHLLSDACAICVAWFAAYVVISTVLNHTPFVRSDLMAALLSTVLSSGLMLFLIYRSSGKFSSHGFRVNIGLNRAGRPAWQIFGLPILLGGLFASVSVALVFLRPEQPQTPLNQMLATETSSGVMMFFLLVAVMLVPLTEELIFRGYFFRVFAVNWGRGVAIALITLIFAFLHVEQNWGDWQAIGLITLVGFVLTLLRARLNSTVPGIVMHYSYNALVTILPVVFLSVTNPAFLEYHARHAELSDVEQIALLEESLQADPDLSIAANDLAWLYAQNNTRLEDALGLVDRALRSQPENVAYLDTKAYVLTKLGRTKEARAIRKDLLKRDISEELRRIQREALEL